MLKKVFLARPLTKSDLKRLNDIWPNPEGKDYYFTPDGMEMTIKEPRDITKSIRLDKWLQEIEKKGGRVEEL